MTPEQFVYWLQGYLEITKDEMIDKDQTQIIKEHLSLVFHKVTPTVSVKYGPFANPMTVRTDVPRVDNFCSSDIRFLMTCSNDIRANNNITCGIEPYKIK